MMIGANTQTFYLSFYFQSANGLTASQSGIRVLPYLISVCTFEVFAGIGVGKWGVYYPFMTFGTLCITIASGLLRTLEITPSTARVIDFQILAGVGFGSSLSLCATVVRANIKKKDIPAASILAGIAPFFGGSLAAGIGQNIFRSALTQRLLQNLSMSQTAAVLTAGATGAAAIVGGENKEIVREAYNYAINITFAMSVAAGGMSFLCAISLKWKNIKEIEIPIMTDNLEVRK